MTVAIAEPSDNRVDRLKWPLNEAGVAVDVLPEATPLNPATMSEDYDAIILDTPNVGILKWSYVPTETPIVYRLRGNLWKAHLDLRAGWLRTFVFDSIGVQGMAGALTPSPRLDQYFRERTGINTTTVAEMPIAPSNWPTVSHEGETLQIVTLTNADYKEKVQPIIDWMAVVNRTLAETGGRWLIGGDGKYSDRLDRAASQYESIEYGGYIDAEASLKASNLMLHPSWFDIRAPNAMVEGMASNLPVVTTDFSPFGETPTVQVTQSTLQDVLIRFTDAREREVQGLKQRKYLHEQHNPATIGSQIKTFIDGL